jgi:hypothetical protein
MAQWLQRQDLTLERDRLIEQGEIPTLFVAYVQ